MITAYSDIYGSTIAINSDHVVKIVKGRGNNENLSKIFLSDGTTLELQNSVYGFSEIINELNSEPVDHIDD
jgi:hypothetical protein